MRICQNRLEALSEYRSQFSPSGPDLTRLCLGWFGLLHHREDSLLQFLHLKPLQPGVLPCLKRPIRHRRSWSAVSWEFHYYERKCPSISVNRANLLVVIYPNASVSPSRPRVRSLSGASNGCSHLVCWLLQRHHPGRRKFPQSPKIPKL